MAPHAIPWILDGHLDLGLNNQQFGRAISQPLDAIRAADGDRIAVSGTATVSLPEMQAGGVGMTFATLLALPATSGQELAQGGTSTPEEANAVANRDLAYYRELEAAGHLRIITDRASLEAQVSQWDAGADDRRVGIVLLMEGAEPILSPADLPEWWARGLRLIGPAWYRKNRYTHGTGTPGRLTDLGRELIRRMEQVGMILDASHLAEAAFFETLELFGGHVLASHSNVRQITPGDRQLSDEMIRRLVERDGVIGAVLDGWMLTPGWKRGQSNTELTCANVADHIDHICQVAGDAKHAAIGTDLDGGFGREQCPSDIDSIADLPRVLEVLIGRGYDDDDVRTIAHENWVGVLRRAWGD